MLLHCSREGRGSTRVISDHEDAVYGTGAVPRSRAGRIPRIRVAVTPGVQPDQQRTDDDAHRADEEPGPQAGVVRREQDEQNPEDDDHDRDRQELALLEQPHRTSPPSACREGRRVPRRPLLRFVGLMRPPPARRRESPRARAAPSPDRASRPVRGRRRPARVFR